MPETMTYAYKVRDRSGKLVEGTLEADNTTLVANKLRQMGYVPIAIDTRDTSSFQRELKLPTLGNRMEGGRSGLHVMVVRGRTRARLLALTFSAAARGTRAMTRTPELDGYLVRACTIEQRHSTVAVDGEVVKLDSPLHYELGRGALRLVVPPPSSTI